MKPTVNICFFSSRLCLIAVSMSSVLQYSALLIVVPGLRKSMWIILSQHSKHEFFYWFIFLQVKLVMTFYHLILLFWIIMMSLISLVIMMLWRNSSSSFLQCDNCLQISTFEPFISAWVWIGTHLTQRKSTMWSTHFCETPGLTAISLWVNHQLSLISWSTFLMWNLLFAVTAYWSHKPRLPGSPSLPFCLSQQCTLLNHTATITNNLHSETSSAVKNSVMMPC